MARTRKTAEQKIGDLEAAKSLLVAKIEKLKDQVAKIDASIQSIENGQKEKELAKLLEAIKASGRSPEEVLAALKSA